MNRREQWLLWMMRTSGLDDVAIVKEAQRHIQGLERVFLSIDGRTYSIFEIACRILAQGQLSQLGKEAYQHFSKVLGFMLE